MIDFKNVSFAYENNRPVLSSLSFHIQKGETVGLIGANGAGKSTVMKLLLGLVQGEGIIHVADIPVQKNTLAKVRRVCGYVLQNSDDQMFMPTVLEDMLFGPLNYGTSRQEAEEKAAEVLSSLGIAELKNRYNHRISGGEKRMAAIATVLAMEPEVLLMDEPTAALDPYNRRQIINTVKKLPQTKLITSHDLDMILDTCERVILLGEGRIAADGPAQEILTNKKLLESYRLELPLRYSGSLI